VSDTHLSEVGRAGPGLPTLSDPPSAGEPTPEPPWAHAYLPFEGASAGDPSAPGSGWSRRDFIKGIIASGVTVSGLSYFGAGCTPSLPAQTTAGFERLISLNVNGQVRRVDVLPNETLAMTLRYKLGLTGTKLGCDRAECGACTVLIDDVNYYSCTTLTHRVRDREVTTVEGLVGPNGVLHPVQQAFVDELGPQCGFCTPGQVMSAVALLRRNPSPTREEAREAMAGNLCRCGAYHHYLNGVMRAAGAREA
jgi:aerobic-type carbon monoxide dehydrogenase small subunit (CoxS/CutS family)